MTDPFVIEVEVPEPILVDINLPGDPTIIIAALPGPPGPPGSVATLTSPKIASGNAPATATSTGTVGQIEWDSGFIYVCTATNTWKRVAIAAW